MVTIEQLMEFGSRRKVEGIAVKMGYSKGSTEYPDEVLEEVRKQCSNGKKRSVSAKAQDAAEDQAGDTADADLKSIQMAAESRAAGLLVAFDSLTMMHCATRKFSDPNLQEAVNESQTRLREFLGGVANVYSPESFLSQTPLVLTAGGNGSMRSLPSSESLQKLTEPEKENGQSVSVLPPSPLQPSTSGGTSKTKEKGAKA